MIFPHCSYLQAKLSKYVVKYKYLEYHLSDYYDALCLALSLTKHRSIDDRISKDFITFIFSKDNSSLMKVKCFFSKSIFFAVKE